MSARTVMRGVALLGATAVLASMTMAPAASAAPAPHASPQPAPRSAALDAFNDWTSAASSAFDIGSFIWTCLATIGGTSPCAEEDPRQAIFDKLDALDSKIDAHFEKVNQRLDGLETLATEIKIGQAQTDLATIQNAGNVAWDKYKLLQACAKSIKTSRAKECTVGGQKFSADKALELLREDFVKSVAQGKAAVPLAKLQGIFGGVQGTTSNGFVYDLWRLYRVKQNQATGAVNMNAANFHVGAITYEISQEFTQDLKVYGEILGRWGAVLVLSAGLTKDGDSATRKAKGNLKLTEVRNAILDRNVRGSAAQVINAYWIPNLQPGQMIAVNRDGTAVKIGNAGGITTGWKQMSTDDLEGISQKFATYASASKARAAYPKSFPGSGYFIDVPAYKRTVYGCLSGTVWSTCSVYTKYDKATSSPMEYVLMDYYSWIGEKADVCRNGVVMAQGKGVWPGGYKQGFMDSSALWIGKDYATAIADHPKGNTYGTNVLYGWRLRTGQTIGGTSPMLIDFTYKDLPLAPGVTSNGFKFGYGVVLKCESTRETAQYKVLTSPPIMLK